MEGLKSIDKTAPKALTDGTALLRLGGPSAKARLGGGSLDHLMEAKRRQGAPDIEGGTTATRKESHTNDN